MFLSANSVYYPNFIEAKKADSVVKMLKYQYVPTEREVLQVINAISCDNDERFKLIDAFNYGMIMGIRAERARRRGGGSRG